MGRSVSLDLRERIYAYVERVIRRGVQRVFVAWAPQVRSALRPVIASKVHASLYRKVTL